MSDDANDDLTPEQFLDMFPDPFGDSGASDVGRSGNAGDEGNAEGHSTVWTVPERLMMRPVTARTTVWTTANG